jgi:hypothetical protein
LAIRTISQGSCLRGERLASANVRFFEKHAGPPNWSVDGLFACVLFLQYGPVLLILCASRRLRYKEVTQFSICACLFPLPIGRWPLGILLMRCLILLFFSLPIYAQTWFSSININPAFYSCSIGWTTAVPTIAHIEYGLAPGAYTKTNTNSTQYWKNKTEVISGLTPGTIYHFRIAAADASKDWIKSLDYVCKTKSATTATSHSVNLNWHASTSTGVTGYNVYRSTISGGYYAFVGKVSSLTYSDHNVQSGTTYFYTVKAVSSSGLLSVFSNQVQAAIP